MPHAEAGSGNGDLSPEKDRPVVPEAKRKRYDRLAALMQEAGRERALTFDDIAAMADIEPVALIGEWLSAGAWLFVGRPKCGKSYLLLQMMGAIAGGAEFLGWKCRCGEVLAIFAEDNNQRLKHRLAITGIAHPPLLLPPPGCFVFTREMLKELARKYNNPENEDAPHLQFDGWLALWLKEHPKVRLILIDTETVVRLIWSGQVESNLTRVTDSDYWSSEKWDDFALKRCVTVLLVNHSSKERGRKVRNPHEMVNASNTKVGGVTGSIVLHDPEGADLLDPRQKQRILSVMGRDMPESINIGVHQNEEAKFVNDGVWHEVRQTQAQQQALEALLAIQKASGVSAFDEWVEAKDIGERTGQSGKAVARCLGRMLEKGATTWKGFRVLSSRGRGYRLDPFGSQETQETKETKETSSVTSVVRDSDDVPY